jgi:predicted dehydrogenase
MGLMRTVAVVGLGWMGNRLADAVRKSASGNLVGGVDPSRDARESFANVFCCQVWSDLEVMLNEIDVDACIVATPNHLHYQQCRLLLERGVNVLVEKPMTTRWKHAVQLAEIAENKRLLLQVGYHRRFNPGYRTLRELIKNGRIGVPRLVTCLTGQDWWKRNLGSWRTGAEADGGGMFLDTGSHLVEILLWSLEATPIKTCSVLVEEKGLEINCSISSALAIQGAVVPLSLTLCGESTGFVPEERILIWGTHGRIEYCREPSTARDEDVLTLVPLSGSAEVFRFPGTTDPSIFTEAKVKDFLRALDGTTPQGTSARDGAVLVAFHEAVRESSRLGSMVPIPSSRA